MVQLKVPEGLQLFDNRYQFQFLYGTIKSIGDCRIVPAPVSFNSCMVQLKAADTVTINLVIKFQFLYGTIKSKGYVFDSSVVNRFNSCMVQLKASLAVYSLFS